MIARLALVGALTVIPAIAQKCDPPPTPKRVVANCYDSVNGWWYNYDGSDINLPAGCIVIGIGDTGPDEGPVMVTVP